MHLGFYKDPWLESAGETNEDVYANWTLKKTKDWKKITVTFTAHELTAEKLAILQSWLVLVIPYQKIFLKFQIILIDYALMILEKLFQLLLMMRLVIW